MRIVIAGGGTGGHVFPGIAVAQEIRRRMGAGVEIVFIGTESGLEARVVPALGFPIRHMRAGGVLDKSLLQKVRALWLLALSTLQCRRMYKEYRPSVVIGTGGYVSAAPVVAARLASVPTVLMEQNCMPGLANRTLSRVASVVAVTYHESRRYFGSSWLTGNPIRQEIARGDRRAAMKSLGLREGAFTVLVLGGSAGAVRVNSAVLGMLGELSFLRERIQFVHQTGERDYEAVSKTYMQLGYRAFVSGFIEDMAGAYAVADIVISRAGATSLAEITAIGIPSILIPYPFAGGHQELNARALLNAGGCLMIRDSELTSERLAKGVRMLCEDVGARDEMRLKCRSLGRPDAAQRVVDLAMSLVRENGG